MSKLRFPAMSHGIVSLLWALLFTFYIWLAGVSIGQSSATGGLIAIVAGCAIFLFVRIYGED